MNIKKEKYDKDIKEAEERGAKKAIEDMDNVEIDLEQEKNKAKAEVIDKIFGKLFDRIESISFREEKKKEQPENILSLLGFER